jgi:hypothetical protein
MAYEDFRYTDPRSLDGDVFSVTHATFLQAHAVGDLYAAAIDDAAVFARNAEMERQLLAGGEPDGAGFGTTPLGARMEAVSKLAGSVQQALGRTAMAAAYDPNNPPKETSA